MGETEREKKRQLEEELKEAEKEEAHEKSIKPEAKKAVTKEVVQGELTRVASEAVREGKKEEARTERDKLETPKESVPAHKPEMGLALEEHAMRAKSREHLTPSEVRRDEFHLQSKAAELRDRALEERVREEELAKGEKLFRGHLADEKKAAAPPPERRRIRRPPTLEEREREERKARGLEYLKRKEELRKKLEAQAAASRKAVSGLDWMRLQVAALLTRIRRIFKLK